MRMLAQMLGLMVMQVVTAWRLRSTGFCGGLQFPALQSGGVRGPEDAGGKSEPGVADSPDPSSLTLAPAPSSPSLSVVCSLPFCGVHLSSAERREVNPVTGESCRCAGQTELRTWGTGHFCLWGLGGGVSKIRRKVLFPIQWRLFASQREEDPHSLQWLHSRRLRKRCRSVC